MDNYVLCAAQTCSLSGGSGKAIICLCNNETPSATSEGSSLCSVCLMKQQLHMPPSAHLSLYLQLQLQSESPAASDRTSVCCKRLMNGSFRVKMTAV